MTPIIRPALPSDAQALSTLKLATFRETFLEGGFNIPYPPDDLAIYEQIYLPERVAEEIAAADHATWVVESDGELIGNAHVGPCKLPHPDVDHGHGELRQLYLRQTAQGLGLGKRLLYIAIDHLAVTRPGPIWLGVWSGNLKAQRIYERQGFQKVGEYDFPVGNWRDHEFIMRRG